MRIKQLDFLRTIAVLLVIGRHLDGPHPSELPLVKSLFHTWQRVGWVGVDLFFVLSGYLIGGLLMRELKETGSLRVGRFLVRRGFKIYPSFYVMIAATIVFDLLFRRPLHFWNVTSELLFFQNYQGGICVHTWSLAIEEHFYLLLPLGLLLLLRFGGPASLPRRLGPILIASIVVVAVTRCLSVFVLHAEPHKWTHARLDGLLFGVLLSHAAQFHGPSLASFVRRYRVPLLGIGTLLAAVPPAFFDLETNPWSQSVGFTLLYVGFGCILLVALETPVPRTALLRLPFEWIAWAGTFSYSVYLWHLLVLGTFWVIWPKIGHPPHLVHGLLCVTVSFAVGIILSKLIEMPALAVRDRLFPASSKARPAPATAHRVAEPPASLSGAALDLGPTESR